MSVDSIREERTQIYHDIFDGIIPKRVPIEQSFTPFSVAQYAGIDPRICYWTPDVLLDKAMEIADRIHTDKNPFGFSILSPARYEALGAKSIVMASNGFMQHPNTHMMEPEEYDEFIKDPLAFIVEKGFPRVYKNLDFNNNPALAILTLSIAEKRSADTSAKSFSVSKALDEKYGYCQIPKVPGGYAPMDILTDELRSFSGMLVDLRRRREKVIEAVEAFSPINYWDCLPEDLEHISRYGAGSNSLHMATFMRPKDFQEIYWPAYKRQVESLASEGIRCLAFLEEDWTNLLDYVYELPVGTEVMLEKADPKLAKEKLGKKHILCGGFPIEYLSQLTKEEAADKAKEFIDIMAPGGNYIFSLNKGILCAADCNLDNFEAVIETVLERGVYSNAGEKTGMPYHKEDYQNANFAPIKSRVFTSWEDYLEENPYTPTEAKETIRRSMKNMISSILFLMK